MPVLGNPIPVLDMKVRQGKSVICDFRFSYSKDIVPGTMPPELQELSFLWRR